MSEKQSEKPKYPGCGRGGPRKNSGRPKGSTNKINPSTLINDFHRTMGMSFSQFVNKKIRDAEKSGDDQLVAKYILGLGNYFVNNVQQHDVTTNGESLNTNFSFPKQETTDWSKIPVTITTKDA
jgi:hypothetical protein